MILDERGNGMKKNDLLLAAVILAAAFILLASQLLRDSGTAPRAVVTVDGQVFGTYSMGEDKTIDIGGTNRLVIKSGAARIDWADCPDQICVDHREISREGESIICLPNKVVVSIEGGEQADLDGVAQ